MTDMATIEQLVLAKAQLQNQSASLVTLLAAVTCQQGKETKKGAVEYRLTKAQLASVDGRAVQIRSLKTGGVVIEVGPPPG